MSKPTKGRAAGLRPPTPYQSETGKPLLRDSVVAWVDILGFRNIADDAAAKGEAQRLLELLAGALGRVIEGLEPSRLAPSDPPFWAVKAFTDNIVVGFPVSERSPIKAAPELGMVAYRVGRFQLELAVAGFFVRGAIAVGPLYMDDNLVYGAGLTDAYSAERHHATNPRVILARSARAVLDKEAARSKGRPKTPTPEAAQYWQDADQHAFVNYLYDTIQFEHDVGYPDTETFVQHANVLRAKLTESVRDPRVWSKYAWAARYHNAFLDLRPDFPEEARVDVASLSGELKAYP